MSVLTGCIWYGDDEPTTGVLPGQLWIAPTSGVISSRNTGNNTWVTTGNVNSPFFGGVNKAGDTVTGPILNIPNVLPEQDPDAQGSLSLDGFPVATQPALSQMYRSLIDYINTSVRQQFLNLTKLSGTAANIAANSLNYHLSITQMLTSGSTPAGSGPGQAIILPTFLSDGVQATQEQVLAYGWALNGAPLGGAGFHNLIETAPGSMVLHYSDSGDDGDTNIYFNTWVIAAR